MASNLENAMDIKGTALMYSIYSLPNCILPLFGGFFVDKLGIRLGNVVFTGILVIG